MAPAQNDLGIEFEALYGPVLVVTHKPGTQHIESVSSLPPVRKPLLSLRHNVVFSPRRPADGGTGAFYVLLRKTTT